MSVYLATKWSSAVACQKCLPQEQGGSSRPRLCGAEHRRNRGSVRVSGQAKERFVQWRVQRSLQKSTRSVPSIPRSTGDPEAQRRGATVKRPGRAALLLHARYRPKLPEHNESYSLRLSHDRSTCVHTVARGGVRSPPPAGEGVELDQYLRVSTIWSLSRCI